VQGRGAVKGSQCIRVPRVVVASVQGVGVALAFWGKDKFAPPVHTMSHCLLQHNQGASHQCVPAPALWSV
jgi:hypothetical protein